MRAVRAIANGELWFSRRTISRVLTTFLFEQHLKRLTSREIEILMLIGSGFSNQEIGNQLFISRETVRWHVRGLYSKLGIVNRPDALEYLRSLYGSGTRIPAQSETAKNTWSRLLTAR
jgi:LuxR family transcriptional regulator of csgAB operon